MTGVHEFVETDYWQNEWPDRPTACTRANAADAYPRPLTPLSLDLVMRYEDQGAHRLYRSTLRVLPEDREPQPFMRAAYGLVYFDVENLAAVGDGLPGSSRADFYEQFFGLERDPTAARPPVDARAELASAARVLPRLLKLQRVLPAKMTTLTAEIRAARPSGELSLAACSTWLRRLDAHQVNAWWVLISAATVAAANFELVVKAIRRWVGDTEAAGLANGLHVNLGGNESAEAGRAITALARLGRDDPRFDAEFARVIERFGHRGPGELELANPSWRADPSRLLALLDRAATSEKQATATTAEAEFWPRLRPWQRPIMRALLKRSRKWMPLRENAKTPVTVLWDELRQLVDAAGNHLVAAGAISKAGDLLYLRHDELHAVLQGTPPPDGTEIARRREAYGRCLSYELPELGLLGPDSVRPLPDEYLHERGLVPPKAFEASATTLHGLGTAPGRLRATARVLADADEDFDPGDVLVTRTVDPGWSPIIAMAGAMVLDVGGPMSHGAIVARELGIPCVVNVKVGTKLIPDGSTIVVDGDRGEVLIEEPTTPGAVTGGLA